jgi:hypothetical protein
VGILDTGLSHRSSGVNAIAEVYGGSIAFGGV